MGGGNSRPILSSRPFFSALPGGLWQQYSSRVLHNTLSFHNTPPFPLFFLFSQLYPSLHSPFPCHQSTFHTYHQTPELIDPSTVALSLYFSTSRRASISSTDSSPDFNSYQIPTLHFPVLVPRRLRAHYQQTLHLAPGARPTGGMDSVRNLEAAGSNHRPSGLLHDFNSISFSLSSIISFLAPATPGLAYPR